MVHGEKVAMCEDIPGYQDKFQYLQKRLAYAGIFGSITPTQLSEHHQINAILDRYIFCLCDTIFHGLFIIPNFSPQTESRS